MVAKVFTIPPGAPFLKTFVRALLDGEIVKGFSRALGPLEIAEAMIYVPTQRAARALAEELAIALDRPATLLPRLLPLGALDATETSLLFEEPGFEPALSEQVPLAASPIERRMLLAELVLQWSEALKHAIISIDGAGQRRLDETQACLVGTSPVDAWYLAGELSSLIDELIIEDIAWTKLDPLVLPEFDAYWRITMDFLDIAMRQWPEILSERGLVDPATRRMALVDRQNTHIRSGKTGPVIAIGSTGSNKATARLLAAIAAAPQGAVVLPGLDQRLDERAWAQISIGVSADVEPCFGHPQAALARLLPILGVRREDVVPLGDVTPALTARGAFISEAMRPADTTDLWLAHRNNMTDAELDGALSGITLIEASDEREEALCLALALREILEHPQKTAALVTPDRVLARRVKAELLRWNVEVDDSAGDVLSLTPHGRLARLIANGTGRHIDLLSLLQHPYAHFGLPREEIERLLLLYEIGIARAGLALDLGNPQDLVEQARALAKDSRHPVQKRLAALDWEKLAKLLQQVRLCLEPLLTLKKTELSAYIIAHRDAFARIAADDHGNLPGGDDLEALEALFDELTASASSRMKLDAETYAHFFIQVAQEIRVKGPARAHPRVKIFGLLEARLMDADVLLLGGLDETVWPPQAQTDAFLNRPMRAELGLTPPERKIGQTAHDFTQAMGHETVILSRAAKRDGTPTVTSRFIQRLAALGSSAWDGCKTRGETLLTLARTLDQSATFIAPIERPVPKPPLALRPTKLSVTRIETLRRDPYAVYAESILGLSELSALDQEIELRAIGTAMHEAIAKFTLQFPSSALPIEASDILRTYMHDACADFFLDPDFALFGRKRIEEEVAFLIDIEARRRQSVKQIETEMRGELAIPLLDGSTFTLSAVADRIEHLRDGTVAILDYKTGTPPGLEEVRAGFAPQLTLEAAMATRGAFGLPDKTRVKEALYLKLGGARSFERNLNYDNKKDPISFEDLVQKHYEDLFGLLNQLRDESLGYPSRPFPKFAARYNAYDHLARVKEWSLGAAAEDQ